MIKQAEGTFEYSQSLKIMNKITPVMLNEVSHIIGEIVQVTHQHTLIVSIKSTLIDMTNILKQIILLLREDYIDKQFVIEMVSSITELICDMLKEVVELHALIDYMSITNENKLHVKYQLDYLSKLFEQIID